MIVYRALGGADCNVAWAGRGMGLFVMDAPSPRTVDLEAIAVRGVITCTLVLGDADMTLTFIPAGERFHFATQAQVGLRALTLVADPISTLETVGLQAT